MSTNGAMPPVYVDFLNRFDIEDLHITDAEIIAAIEDALAAQGRGETVIEPRMHLEPGGRGAISTCCAAQSPARSTSPGSRSSAISSTTISSAFRPSWRRCC